LHSQILYLLERSIQVGLADTSGSVQTEHDHRHGVVKAREVGAKAGENGLYGEEENKGSAMRPLYAEHSQGESRYLGIGEIRIDTYRHKVSYQGENISLTPTEYKILSCLLEQPGRVLSCSDIVVQTHGYSMEYSRAKDLLRQHMRNLRQKIEEAYFVSIRGFGYMLIDPHLERSESYSDDG